MQITMLDDILPAEYEQFADLVHSGGTIGPAIEELFNVWTSRYSAGSNSDLTVIDVNDGDGELLFDRTEREGDTTSPRALGVAAFLHEPSIARDTTYQAGYPHARERYGLNLDRGHMLPHSGGGQISANIFPQDERLNRGWSADGKQYRRIENEAAATDSFFFCALLYCDDTDFPAMIELGTVSDTPGSPSGKTVLVQTFRNRFDPAAISAFPLPEGENDALREVIKASKNSQLAGLGEECAREFLESAMGAEIVTMGDARMERTDGRQDLDLVVFVDGELVAIEVKTRFLGAKAGVVTRAGNLRRPTMNRARRDRAGRVAERQGTPSYAAVRLGNTLERPDDGVVETWCLVVDLKGMLVQPFPIGAAGRAGRPLCPPADCTEAANAAAKTIIDHQGHL